MRLSTENRKGYNMNEKEIIEFENELIDELVNQWGIDLTENSIIISVDIDELLLTDFLIVSGTNLSKVVYVDIEEGK